MFDIISIIKTGGYLGLFGIVFAECGLLVGFFLPGDSLLFTAGILASQGYLNIGLLLFLLFTAAVLGQGSGYFIGYKAGQSLFNKPESLFFSRSNVEHAERFFARYGTKTIILARFVPVVRTFVPVLAGVGKMNGRVFWLYNVIGALLWIGVVTLTGYFLGTRVPNIDHYLAPTIIGIIVLSLLPAVIEILRHEEARMKIVRQFRQLFGLKK